LFPAGEEEEEEEERTVVEIPSSLSLLFAFFCG
jgi:hypothetical protein